jgi:hypothetical protein
MKLCTNCGYRNPDLSSYCMQCGHDLAKQPSPVMCPYCSSPNIPFSTFCESCGKMMSPRKPEEAQPVSGQPQISQYLPSDTMHNEPKSFLRMLKEKGNPFWAGVLMVLGGISDVGNGVATFFREIPPNDLNIDLSGYVAFCATFVIVLGIGALLGGLVSLTKKHFYVAITGAIMGMLGIGFFYTGFILCLIALILVAVSKDDFSDYWHTLT